MIVKEKSFETDFYIQTILVNRAVVIFCRDSNKLSLLRHMNGRRRWFSRYVWEIKYSTKQELAQVLNELRNYDVPFSSSPFGWGPSEIFSDLKEKGYIDGEIKEICWRGGGKYILRKKS